MACFIVPLTQAIATTVYRKHVEKKVQLEGEKCLSTVNYQIFTHLKSLERNCAPSKCTFFSTCLRYTVVAIAGVNGTIKQGI